MKQSNDFIRKTFLYASCLGFLALCVVDLVICGHSYSLMNLVSSLVCACTLVLLLPIGRQRVSVIWYLAAFALLCSILASVFQLKVPGVAGVPFRLFLPVAAAVAVTQTDGVVQTLEQYRSIRSLFKSSRVQQNIEEHAKLQRCLLFYISMLAAFSQIWSVSMVILALVIVLQVLPQKVFLLISKHKFLQVRAIVNGSLKDNIVLEEGEGKDMSVTYRKAQEYMENSKPYLRQTLSLEDLARELGTNKVYLSRTINVVSGRNFCQFVNYYRIQYAKEMMLSNPGTKMIEVALASGFNSVVTFNMAFKLNEKLTPSEWLREYNSI